MRFVEDVQLAGTRRRSDGYLVADARVARTGIQQYLGIEVGRPDLPVVNVLRPEEEVFADEAMASFAHRPVTNDHPREAVTAENWKKYAVGQTSDEVKREDKFLRIPLMVADASAIADVERGKRQLSAGYSCDLEWVSGEYDGQHYDAIQRNIRANHVAIVQRGRAGNEVRIGDGTDDWGAAPITDAAKKGLDMQLRKVMVDGLPIETTDAGATAIEKLTADRDSIQRRLDDAIANYTSTISAKDAELAKKDAEIEKLKAQALDQKAIDQLVANRAALEAKAAAIAKDVKATGLSDAELKKAVVAAKLGDAAIAGKSEAYIDARFDILAEDAAKADPFRDAVATGVAPRIQNLDSMAAERQKAFDELMRFDQTGKEAN